MNITTSKQDQWLVLAVDGDITHDFSPEFSDTLLHHINSGDLFLRLDLKACEFICSSGLGAIAASLMVARSRGGDIELTHLTHNVHTLFRTTKLDTIIKIRKQKH